MAPQLRHTQYAIYARTIEAGQLSELQLFPAGEFLPSDGRKVTGPWLMDEEAARLVIADAQSRQNPFVVDYDHQTIFLPENGQPAPAAGWFRELEWRPGQGLFAVDVEWTDRARDMIGAREYRFISPVFNLDENTGRVRRLLHAGLTNVPAIDGMRPVAARFESQTGDPVIEKLRELLGLSPEAGEDEIYEAIVALQKKGDGLEEEVVALRSQQRPDPSKYVPLSELKKVQEEVIALRSESRKEKVDRLVRSALESGRLLPKQEEWARSLGTQSPETLEQFLDTAEPLVALRSLQSGGQAPGGVDSRLTEEELYVCRQRGWTEEEFLKLKEAK